MELDDKYVLHIPLCRYSEGKLAAIDIDEILDELIARLGQDSFYITRVESHYKSRVFDELLLTVFTANEPIGEIFRDWFLENNDVLQQEALAFEHNGRLVIEKIEKVE